MRTKKASAPVTAAMFEVVENQIKAGTPPEARSTLERLRAEGLSRNEAVQLIACVVADEIFNVMSAQEAFNEDRYVMNLRNLPKLPWE